MLTFDVSGVLTVTLFFDWERMLVDTPSNVTEVMSLPVPRVQPVMVTLNEDMPATLFGRTLSIIPTEDWKLGERVGVIDGLVVGYPDGGADVGTMVGSVLGAPGVGETVGLRVAPVMLRQDAEGEQEMVCVAMILSSFNLDHPAQPVQPASQVLPVILTWVVPEGRFLAEKIL